MSRRFDRDRLKTSHGEALHTHSGTTLTAVPCVICDAMPSRSSAQLMDVCQRNASIWKMCRKACAPVTKLILMSQNFKCGGGNRRGGLVSHVEKTSRKNHKIPFVQSSAVPKQARTARLRSKGVERCLRVSSASDAIVEASTLQAAEENWSQHASCDHAR